MAQLLSGTRIYGTATVDTQLFVNGNNQAVSTNTGALQVAGGVGINSTLFVGSSSTLSGITKITDTTEALTTTSGALVVSGGVAVAKDLRVHGTIYGLVNGTVIGVITTASNLASGTTGQIPFQISNGVTDFFGPGTSGQILVSAGTTSTGPVFTNTASIYVGRSALNDDLVGGSGGSIPYQTGANDTTFLPIGASGLILASTGSAPEWATTSSLIVGKATQSDTALLTNDISSNETQYITFVSTTTGYTPIKGSAVSGLTFKPNGGYLGLGSATPSFKLHVAESADVVPAHIERPLGGDILQLYNASGLTNNYTQLSFVHKDSTNTLVSASRIAGYASSLGAGAVSGGLIFYVRNAGTQNEGARLDNLGNFGIGIEPTCKLDVNGGARIAGITTVTNVTQSSSTATGALQVAGGVGINKNVHIGGQLYIAERYNVINITNDTADTYIDFASPLSGSGQIGLSQNDGMYISSPGSLPVLVLAAGSTKLEVGNTTTIVKNNLQVDSDLAVNGGDITSNQTTFNLLASGITTLNAATSATTINIGSNSAGTTNIRNILSVSTNTQSTAVGNGALVVAGGTSIAGDLRIGGTFYGNVSVSGTITTATNLAGGTTGQIPYQTSTGFTSFFGPGIAGQILVSAGSTETGPVFTNTSSIYVGFAGVADQFKVTDDLSSAAVHYITFTTANSGNVPLKVDSAELSFIPSTGRLGIGTASPGAKLDVNGASFLRGITTVTDTTVATSVSSGALQVRGGAGFAADIYATGGVLDAVRVGVTAANEIDTSAGNLILDSAGGTVQIDDNLIVVGNLTVQGTTTVVDSTVTNVSDPIFTIGTGPNGAAPAADDNKDRGIAFHWHNGATARVGFFGYDDSTGYFTFLTSATFVNEVASPAGGTTRGAVDVNLAGGAAGSIPYQTAANVSTFLPIGSTNQILTVQSGLPVWTAASGITAGNATTVEMTNDVASTTPQFIAFVGTATGPAAIKASALSGLTFIPSSSSLGLGIASPSYPLHINVPSGLASIGLSGTAANAQTIKIMQGVTGVTNAGFSIYDISNSTTRLMIGSTGNVGIGTATQDPSDRLHVSNNGGTAQLRVGDTASTQAGILLQRRNSGIDAQTHWFNASANSPWYLFGQNLTWTGERAGTVTATHAHRPYYEAYAPVVGYKEFGFANVTTGAIATGNLIPSLVLKNDGYVGINTTNPTDYLTIDAKGSSASNYGLTIKDSTVNAVNETTGIKFAWNTANAADIRAIVTNIATGASALAFGTSNDGSTISERMRIAQGGNVGIGELDPGAYGKLTVRISSNTGVGDGGSSAIWLQNANGAANNAATIFFGDNAASAMGAINFVHNDYANNYGEISFDTRGSTGYAERMRINNNGNVGISTSTAFSKFHVVSAGNYLVQTIEGDSTYTGFGGGQLRIRGYTNTQRWIEVGYNTTANIGFLQAGINGSTTQPIHLNPDGANVCIPNAGSNLGVGTASPNAKLDVSGGVFISGVTTITNTTQATSTITGALRVSGGVGIVGNLHVGGTINGTIVGTISGIATTATTITITNETASATTHYLTFVDGTGNKNVKIDTSELAFVPSTNRLGIGTNAPGYTLDVRGEIYTSGSNMWFAGTTSYIRSNNIFEFLTNSGNAQSSRFKGVQLSTSYSGTIPDDGILFGTDSNFYRSAATTLRTNSTLVVDGNLGVNDTSPNIRLSILQNADVWHARFGATATTKQLRIGGNAPAGPVIGAYNTGDNSSPSALMINRDGGQVIIGSSTAFATSTVPLYVRGGASGWVVFERNSKQLYINANYSDTNTAAQISPPSSNNMALSLSARETLADLYLTTAGRVGMGTTSPLTTLDVRFSNSGAQSPQVNGFTLRTNENNGMEWHLASSGGYAGWVAAARVNATGSSFGSGYLEFITAGSSGGNQQSVMALHGNGNVTIGQVGTSIYKLFVNGSFAATTKSFVIDHPVRAGWKLRYASLEGPENGVYIRGRLKDNNVIVLPDYWRELVDVDTITVEITPVGKYQKLYVDSINPQYVVIATESDMSVNCFYTVYGERKDVGKLVVEYEE